MKKSIISVLLMFVLATTVSFTISSCGAKKTEQVEEIVYACPMHPEVKGKEGDTCNQCGMALEKLEDEDMNNEQH